MAEDEVLEMNLDATEYLPLGLDALLGRWCSYVVLLDLEHSRLIVQHAVWRRWVDRAAFCLDNSDHHVDCDDLIVFWWFVHGLEVLLERSGEGLVVLCWPGSHDGIRREVLELLHHRSQLSYLVSARLVVERKELLDNLLEGDVHHSFFSCRCLAWEHLEPWALTGLIRVWWSLLLRASSICGHFHLLVGAGPGSAGRLELQVLDVLQVVHWSHLVFAKHRTNMLVEDDVFFEEFFQDDERKSLLVFGCQLSCLLVVAWLVFSAFCEASQLTDELIDKLSHVFCQGILLFNSALFHFPFCIVLNLHFWLRCEQRRFNDKTLKVVLRVIVEVSKAYELRHRILRVTECQEIELVLHRVWIRAKYDRLLKFRLLWLYHSQDVSNCLWWLLIKSNAVLWQRVVLTAAIGWELLAEFASSDREDALIDFTSWMREQEDEADLLEVDYVLDRINWIVKSELWNLLGLELDQEESLVSLYRLLKHFVY